jgi:uncharacterized protein (TIRG00374 family)
MKVRRVVPTISLRLLLTGVTIVGVLAFILANRASIPKVWLSVSQAQPQWLGAALLAAVVTNLSIAALHVSAQRALGMRSGLRQLLAPALTAQFLNLIVSSGGLAGLPALRAEGRRHGRDPAAVIGAFLIVALAGQIAVATILPVALVLLATSGHLTATDVAASLVFLGYTAVVAWTVAGALRSPGALRRIYSLPRRAVTVLLRRPPPSLDHPAADALYQALSRVRRSHRRVALVLAYAVAVDISSVALLWCVFRALRLPLGIDVAIVAYAVSLLFSIIGFLPGGLGFVEISLAAVLIAYGTPAAPAGAAVGLYRLFELWLPAVTGAALAPTVLHRRDPQPCGTAGLTPSPSPPAARPEARASAEDASRSQPPPPDQPGRPEPPVLGATSRVDRSGGGRRAGRRPGRHG